MKNRSTHRTHVRSDRVIKEEQSCRCGREMQKTQIHCDLRNYHKPLERKDERHAVKGGGRKRCLRSGSSVQETSRLALQQFVTLQTQEAFKATNNVF